jgi:hypothetical protein
LNIKVADKILYIAFMVVGWVGVFKGITYGDFDVYVGL